MHAFVDAMGFREHTSGTRRWSCVETYVWHVCLLPLWLVLSVLQCEQGNCAHMFVLEALLACGHVALSLIIMIAGDAEMHEHVYCPVYHGWCMQLGFGITQRAQGGRRRPRSWQKWWISFLYYLYFFIFTLFYHISFILLSCNNSLPHNTVHTADRANPEWCTIMSNMVMAEDIRAMLIQIYKSMSPFTYRLIWKCLLEVRICQWFYQIGTFPHQYFTEIWPWHQQQAPLICCAIPENSLLPL